jgi:hypothetical protein
MSHRIHSHSHFAKHFTKRLQIHQRSHFTRVATTTAVLATAEALPKGPVVQHHGSHRQKLQQLVANWLLAMAQAILSSAADGAKYPYVQGR